MSGEYSGNQRGLIPRSIEQILHKIVDMKALGWKMQCKLSIVELYNEELRYAYEYNIIIYYVILLICY